MLRKMILGSGGVDLEDEAARLVLRPASERGLALAQLDDHHPLDPTDPPFTHQPPVRARLYARAWPASPRGAFGFGFWNDPFSSTADSRCLWFYAAGVEGAWKAGVWNEDERSETALDINLSDWGRYEIDWLAGAAVFRVNGVERFRAAVSLPGPLGFAIWMSNRIVTSSGEGEAEPPLCRIDSEQWLEVKSLRIE